MRRRPTPAPGRRDAARSAAGTAAFRLVWVVVMIVAIALHQLEKCSAVV
jgi:hypothetical protein